MLSKEDITRINKAKSISHLNYIIAELLYNNNDNNYKSEVEREAQKYISTRSWMIDNYKIPDMNGLGRPLMLHEDLIILNEDRHSK